MNEKTTKVRKVFNGRLIKVDVLDVKLADGMKARREIVRHPGASAILPRLPDGRFVFVRQFRKPAERELLEITAGTLNKGENPDKCARREVTEETGYQVKMLKKLGKMYTAPGYTDEVIYLYYADLNPVQGASDCDDDEKVTVVYLSAGQVEEAVRKGRIIDSKTLAAWLLFRMKVSRK